MTTMDDLIAFLRARLDEDEAVARAIESDRYGDETPLNWSIEDRPGDPWPSVTGLGMYAAHTYADNAITPQRCEHIVRWDPARVLAEVEAKRRILEDYRITASAVTRIEREGSAEPYWQDVGYQKLVAGRDAFKAAVRALAKVYASHPDYPEG